MDSNIQNNVSTECIWKSEVLSKLYSPTIAPLMIIYVNKLYFKWITLHTNNSDVKFYQM